eukprot:18743_1
MPFCKSTQFPLRVVFILLNTLLLCGCILAMYRFFKYFSHTNASDRPQSNPTMFKIGLMYIFSTILMATYWIISQISFITNCDDIPMFLYQIGFAIYGTQIWCLWLLLFSRVYYVFMNSIYELSNTTVYTVAIFFIIMPIWIGLGWIPWSPKIHNIVAGLTLVFSTIFCVWISYFFLYKLHAVFKHTKSNNSGKDNQLLTIIIKNTLLAVISISLTVMASIMYAIAAVRITEFTRFYTNVKDHIVFWWCFLFIFLFDVCTNFICAMLSYKYFDDYYFICCNWGDKMCHLICDGFINVEAVSNLNANSIINSNNIIEVESTSPKDSQCQI